MAFVTDGLGVLGYCNGFTMWHYRSDVDAAGAIKAGGYFNEVAHLMKLGDIIVFEDANSVSGMRRVALHNSSTVNTGALG